MQGRDITAERKKRGVTRAERLAAEAGIHSNTLYDIERERFPLSDDLARMLMEALDRLAPSDREPAASA